MISREFGFHQAPTHFPNCHQNLHLRFIVQLINIPNVFVYYKPFFFENPQLSTPCFVNSYGILKLWNEPKNAFNWIFPEKNVQNHSSSLLLLILLTHRLGNCFWNQRISIRYNVDKGTMARCGSIKIILMTFNEVESKSSSLPYHEWLWFLFIYSVVAVKDEESVAYVTGTLAQLLLYLLLTSPSS